MSRVELIAASVAAVMGIALAGCSAMPGWMTPGFMSSGSSSQPLQPLRFESDPPGADVHTAQGQTCQTPCALPVASEPQEVTFTKGGYVAQTIQINIGAPPEHSFWQSPPPALVPDPVVATLQRLPPPARPVARRRERRPPPRRTATRTRPPHRPSANASSNPPPMQQQPSQSVFPPPPPMSPAPQGQ
jgi:hypothetical protein